MKYKLLLCTLLFVLLGCSITTNAQGVALDLGYKYHTRSLGYVGGSFAKTSGTPYSSGTTTSFSMGAGGYFGSFRGTAKFIPAAYASFGFGSPVLLDTKVTASQYFVNPSIGLNCINLGKLEIGYSVPLKDINGVKMQGITVALTFSIGSSGYYVDLSN